MRFIQMMAVLLMLVFICHAGAFYVWFPESVSISDMLGLIGCAIIYIAAECQRDE